MFSVLLADDEVMSLYAVKGSFDWNTYKFSKIYETTSSREALEILKNHRIDASFLDIRMPEYSGLEIIERCVSEGIESNFIIITGYSEFNYAQAALRLQATDYCLKPVDMDEALSLIKKLGNKVYEKRINTDPGLLDQLLGSKDNEVKELLNYLNLDCSMQFYRAVCWKGDYFTGYSQIKTPANSVIAFILDNDKCIFIEGHREPNSAPLRSELAGNYVFASNSITQIEQLPALVQHARSVWLNCSEGITMGQFSSAGESLQPILTYLKENLAQDINLNQLAQKFNYNYTYCSELFKKVTGTSFTNYITKIRMDAACDLLKKTDISIEEISAQVGYINYHYFANVFHRHTGMTASQYRQSCKSREGC